MQINIAPLPMKHATVLKIDKCDFIPGQSLTAWYEVLSSSNESLKKDRVHLTGENFQRWRTGSDDVLRELILKEVGASLPAEAAPQAATEPAPEPAPENVAADPHEADEQHEGDQQDAGDEHH